MHISGVMMISFPFLSLSAALKKSFFEAVMYLSLRWYVRWIVSSVIRKIRSATSSSAGFSRFL